jgi:hypothetical protein
MPLPTRLPAVYVTALALLCLPGLSACARNGNAMNPNAAHSPDSTATDPMAEFRNPKPSQALRITMTITGAPGPFAWMRPIAHFDVTNRECLSPPKDNPGGRSAPVPTAPTEFELTQSGEGVYTGVVYADLMRDRDYNGHGICHWELTSVVVQMKPTGAAGETFFVPAIPGSKLSPGNTQSVYYNKNAYTRKDASALGNPGFSDRQHVSPSIPESDLFTINFRVEEEASP